MAVSRSPFSSGRTGGAPPPVDPNKSRVDKWKDLIRQGLNADPGGRPSVDDSGMPSTVLDEKRKLESGYDTALAKIATSGLDDSQKDRAREIINDIYYKGTTELNTGGITNKIQQFGKFIPSVWAAKGTVKAIQKAAEITAPVARGVQSAGKELDDLLRSKIGDDAAAIVPFNTAGLLRELTEPFKTKEQRIKDSQLPAPRASFGDWLKQTKDKDFRVVRTGRSYIDGTLDFVLDVATDPLTYVTVGAGPVAKTGAQAVSYVGRSGRLTLAQRMLTREMVERYPELIGKFDDIASVGVAAIPKHIRKAEGLEFGLRFAGQAIPKSDALAGLISGQSGIGTTARLAGSRAVDAAGRRIAKFSPRTQGLLTPASRAVVNKLEIGRGLGIDDATVVQGIAEYSAAKAAKGLKSLTHAEFLSEVQGLIKEIKKAGVEDKVRRAADNPALLATEPDPIVRELATRYRDWQNGLLQKVNATRTKFNADYGADMKLINELDDYGVHHTMTPQAFRFAYGSKSGITSGWFKDADLLPSEIGGKISAAMHRKYTKGEEFLGVKLQEGTIDEINRVFREQYQRKFGSAPDFDFFQTDLATIADSYAYSMAAARAREGYVRRLLDYGNDVAQVINKKLIPDEELVKNLTGVYNTLKATRSGLLSAVNNGQRLAGRSAREVLDFARKTIVDKDRAKAGLDKAAARAMQQLIDAETALAQAYARAAEKGVEQRGVFLQTHAALVEEITNLKGAIESGRVAEDAAYNVLRSLYLKINPDAKSVPKKASVLHDRIARQMGINDTVEIDELSKRLDAVRAQIAEYKGADPEELNELMEIEYGLREAIDDFNSFENIRQSTVEYAPTGFVYGNIQDLFEKQFDPSIEPTLRMFNTDIVPEVNGAINVDEIAALRNAFLENPESVAVHAFEPEEFFDMRRQDDFWAYWDPENGSGDAVAFALKESGIDNSTFKEVWEDVLNGVTPDPMFAEVYPEMANIVEFLGGVVPRMAFPDGVVDDASVVAVFETLDDMMKDLVVGMGAAPEEAARLSRQLMRDFHLAMVNQNPAIDGLPLMLPSQVFYSSDNQLAEGVYTFLMPDQYNFPQNYEIENFLEPLTPGSGGLVDEQSLMAPIHFTNSSEALKTILDDTYHTEAIDNVELLEATRNRAADLETQLMIRGELESEAKTIGRQIGGKKAAGSRRVKAAEKALKEYEESGLITMTVNGKQQKVTREKAIEVLNAKEAKLNKAQEALERRIAANMDTPRFDELKRRRIRNEERLALIVDQRKVIERWNEKVGDALRADIEFLQEAIMTDPMAGPAGSNSRAWAQRVTDRMNNIELLGDTPVAKAWERVSTQLGADEARLAELDALELPKALMDVQAARVGINGKLVDDIYDGWTALKGTGIQIPEEFDALIRPNVDRLRTAAGRNEFIAAYQVYNQIFKTYATMTVGFIVRNAMSATFMNKVAGVSNQAIIDGTRAAVAWHRFGPNKWLDELGITDPVEREIYTSAMKSVMAGGRGIQSDFQSPVIKKGVGGKLADNWATRKFMRANEFTEDSLRLPMALDTLRKGGTFDEATYRITRYHFDYTDLSRFDETMKNFIPFWVWTTRNLPLQITEHIMRPGYYNAYYNLKERNPVSADVILPSWMQEGGAMSLGGRFVLMPDMPMNRLDQAAESFTFPRIIGQANPLVKLPVELALADKQLALDIPFSDKYEEAKGVDKAVAGLASLLGIDSVGRRDEEGNLVISPKVSYALGNIMPPIATAQRLAGGALGGKSTYQERQLSSVLNFLGVPVREVGPRQQRSELIGRQFKLADLLQELSRKGAIESND